MEYVIHGQLGHGTMVLELAQPRKIEFLNSEKVIDVACGDSHTAVITGIIGIFIGQFFQKRKLLLVLLVRSQFSQKEKEFFSFFSQFLDKIFRQNARSCHDQFL